MSLGDAMARYAVPCWPYSAQRSARTQTGRAGALAGMPAARREFCPFAAS